MKKSLMVFALLGMIGMAHADFSLVPMKRIDGMNGDFTVDGNDESTAINSEIVIDNADADKSKNSDFKVTHGDMPAAIKEVLNGNYKKRPLFTANKSGADRITFIEENISIKTPVIKGLGRNVMLADAIRQILPEGWTAYVGDESVNTEQKITWYGGKEWLTVLNGVAELANIYIVMDWKNKEIILVGAS